HGGGATAELNDRRLAAEPEDLDHLFLERANAGDVEGVVALYEPDAVLAFPPGQLAIGTEQIRAVYVAFLATRPTLSGTTRPAVRNGDLAITSTAREGNATVEVARRQADGAWLWVIDQPSVLD
ncbi:MAG: YybH family protein, partial [Trebonia sp.]